MEMLVRQDEFSCGCLLVVNEENNKSRDEEPGDNDGCEECAFGHGLCSLNLLIGSSPYRLRCPQRRVNLISGETFSPEIVKESAHAAPTHSFAMLIPSMTKPRISTLSKFASWKAVRSSPSANSTKCPVLNWSSIFERVSVSQRVRGSLESRVRKG